MHIELDSDEPTEVAAGHRRRRQVGIALQATAIAAACALIAALVAASIVFQNPALLIPPGALAVGILAAAMGLLVLRRRVRAIERMTPPAGAIEGVILLPTKGAARWLGVPTLRPCAVVASPKEQELSIVDALNGRILRTVDADVARSARLVLIHIGTPFWGVGLTLPSAEVEFFVQRYEGADDLGEAESTDIAARLVTALD